MKAAIKAAQKLLFGNVTWILAPQSFDTHQDRDNSLHFSVSQVWSLMLGLSSYLVWLHEICSCIGCLTGTSSGTRSQGPEDRKEDLE